MRKSQEWLFFAVYGLFWVDVNGQRATDAGIVWKSGDGVQGVKAVQAGLRMGTNVD